VIRDSVVSPLGKERYDRPHCIVILLLRKDVPVFLVAAERFDLRRSHNSGFQQTEDELRELVKVHIPHEDRPFDAQVRREDEPFIFGCALWPVVVAPVSVEGISGPLIHPRPGRLPVAEVRSHSMADSGLKPRIGRRVVYPEGPTRLVDDDAPVEPGEKPIFMRVRRAATRRETHSRSSRCQAVDRGPIRMQIIVSTGCR
jgi:hypothetical protein